MTNIISHKYEMCNYALGKCQKCLQTRTMKCHAIQGLELVKNILIPLCVRTTKELKT
jgi:hypothetical protein